MNTIDFVNYLTSIAPEGETILLVKQTPQEDSDGSRLYHADGAPKAYFNTYLPDQYHRTSAAAWYANTGCFIAERFGARPSFAAANCEAVAFLMLDDIGTKSNTPPLAPTWKIETSPGNYQWGYTFRLEDQPSKADFTAAVRAIAEGGFTDPGATNAVRLFRIPGSVNLKAGKGDFAARMVEFHPTREFSLPEICEALGVVPGPADTAEVRAIRLLDDGKDPVLQWLAAAGHVYAAPNREGWAGVTCPNAAQHSDGNPEGRYNPAMRAFCCYHGHCGHIDSSAFLSWVEAEGGPSAAYGLREELLAATMGEALQRIRPTESFPNAAADIVSEVQRKEIGRVQKADWFSRFAYIQDHDLFFDLEERREVSRWAFNALFRHIGCRCVHNPKRKVEASVSFDQHRQAMGSHTLAGLTYAAGESMLCAREGQVFANRWRDARPEPVPGDARPWLEHVERMIPDDMEREHVLNVMAHRIQFPGVKCNHAILHGGLPGSGKDTLWAPFLWAIGGDSQDNIATVRNEEINSKWGYNLECEVMVVQELRQSEAKDRRALENNLKPLIAAPPFYLNVERKGLAPYKTANRLFMLAFSNERVPISLPSDDRRWFVLWSEASEMTTADSARLWGWYARGGMAAVAACLRARDVSAFDAAATPPYTEAKALMVENGFSAAEAYLVDAIRAGQGEFSRGAVCAPWGPLLDRLQGQAPSSVKLYPAALFHAMREAGWVDKGRVHSRQHPTKKHLFCCEQLAEANGAELRAIAEGPAVSSGALRVVK
jgi:hypothetical protein